MTSTHIPPELRRQIAADAHHTCGYCLSDEWLTGCPLSVDHIIPVAAGGPTVRDNLWLACRPCNEFKHTRTHAEDPHTGKQAPLFDPRHQNWRDHFAWNADKSEVIGLTPTGRATVAALQLNRPMLVRARKRWTMGGWQPPTD
jgi:hypothetical protein